MAITLSGDGIARANLAADVIDSTKLADDAVNSEHYVDASIDNAHLADDAVGVAELSATGTASSSTFLRGDNSWQSAADATKLPLAGGTMTGALVVTAGSGITVNNNASSNLDPSLILTGSGNASQDHYIQMAENWTGAPLAIGMDNSSNKFKICRNSSGNLSSGEQITIDSSGAMCVGGVTADGGILHVFGRIRADDGVTIKDGTTEDSLRIEASSSSHNLCKWLATNNSSSNQDIMQFYRENTKRGSIALNNSSTTYNTSSDYRLKENVDYDWDATTRLKQLKPARFNWINDDTNTLVDGFLAHEVTSIVPEAVTGEKDAMTTEVLYVEGDELPEGKSIGDVKEASVIEPQGIDQSKLVPLLVKTIQELEARITILENP